MGRSANQAEIRQARLKRLAEKIAELAEKDADTLRRIQEITALRKTAANRLYDICAGFVDDVNRLVPNGPLELVPANASGLNEDAKNLIQINIRGRILQVEFEPTDELVSTEDFRIPYTLQGTIRTFNQELLDKDLIQEQFIFYTLEKETSMWRFFDARTYRSGPFDQEYLIELMERLI